MVEDSSGMIHYERSLRLEEAAVSGAILAYVMNGEPLPIHHGFPLRLIVPSWYAVASVKWLTDIELIGDTFAGHFQTEKYWYEWRRGGEDVREPVTRMQVRALITEPNKAPRSSAAILRFEELPGQAWLQLNGSKSARAAPGIRPA
jgi:DMSO/TMAO reductase YedYZ molybdopterin-dependent catalytic subunit